MTQQGTFEHWISYTFLLQIRVYPLYMPKLMPFSHYESDFTAGRLKLRSNSSQTYTSLNWNVLPSHITGTQDKCRQVSSVDAQNKGSNHQNNGTTSAKMIWLGDGTTSQYIYIYVYIYIHIYIYVYVYVYIYIYWLVVPSPNHIILADVVPLLSWWDPMTFVLLAGTLSGVDPWKKDRLYL